MHSMGGWRFLVAALQENLIPEIDAKKRFYHFATL
jgi:hypothetical protein